MKLIRMLLRLEFYLTLGGGLLLLASLGIGRVLPPGEWYGFTFIDGAHLGAYVVDSGRTLVYRLPWAITNGFHVNPTDPRQIVFSQSYNQNDDLFFGDVFSGAARSMAVTSDFEVLPTWSHDGQWIAYGSARTGAIRLYVVGARGSAIRRFTPGLPIALHPAWSPDDQWIVYEQLPAGEGSHLAVTNVGCLKAAETCLPNSISITSSAGSDYRPVWSPDGTQLAFASDRGGLLDIYVMDIACLDTPDGCIHQNARQLTDQAFYRVDDMQWSRDGRLIRIVGYGQAGLGVYTMQAGCDLLPGGCVMTSVISVG